MHFGYEVSSDLKCIHPKRQHLFRTPSHCLKKLSVSKKNILECILIRAVFLPL